MSCKVKKLKKNIFVKNTEKKIVFICFLCNSSIYVILLYLFFLKKMYLWVRSFSLTWCL